MEMSDVFIGGVEGGATHSEIFISNKNGEIIGTASGPGTNYHLIGISGCADRIAEMVANAKVAAGIPESTKLNSLGLSLSGCEQEATNKKLENEIKKLYPNLSEHYVICSDTVGSISTASSLGGLVLISGTGSNAFLKNPDGTTHNCGGWGHILGDEGSAWWISQRAIKTVFDDEDNLNKSPYSTTIVWNLIKSHFAVETRLDLLDSCYANFKKSFFAGLCKRLAEAALEGDQLCLKLFNDAGHLLGKHAVALLPKVHEDLKRSGDLSIVCVGSVFLSWDLLKEGFLKELNKVDIQFGLSFRKLTQKMALGAIYLAADGINFDLPRDYTKNYEVFHYYRQKNTINGNMNGK